MIPKKVKIGCCDYSVKEVLIEAEEDYVGRCYPHQQRIEVDKRLPHQKKVQILFHEILHAICDTGDMKISDRNIDLIATAIVSLFKDNPKLKGLIYERPTHKQRPRKSN